MHLYDMNVPGSLAQGSPGPEHWRLQVNKKRLDSLCLDFHPGLIQATFPTGFRNCLQVSPALYRFSRFRLV